MKRVRNIGHLRRIVDKEIDICFLIAFIRVFSCANKKEYEYAYQMGLHITQSGTQTNSPDTC